LTTKSTVDYAIDMNPNQGLEPRILEIGKEIFELGNKHQMGLFDKKFWSGKLMEWSMQNRDFKIEMFRFVDVLPALESSEQISEHIKAYFLRSGIEMSGFLKAGMVAATTGGITSKIAASTIKKNVTAMAKTFITGENSQASKDTLLGLWNSGIAFTVDILGETVVSEDEALDYQSRYLELIEGLGREVRDWKGQEILEISDFGHVPRANVSIKLSALYSQLDPLAFRSSVDKLKDRVRPLLRSAMHHGVFINFDIEQYEIRNVIYTVAEELFTEPEFISYPNLGVVVQAYLRDSQQDVTRMINLCKKRKSPITVRLVKGAYWDFEIIQARQKGWAIPVFLNKAQTDANYETCARMLIDAYPHIHTALGSHNVRSLAAALAYAESLGLKKNALEIQMLYGMAEPFKEALKLQGFRLRDYAPVGEMLPGMAYLVRRLLENTSNEGFLRGAFVEGSKVELLLQNPALVQKETLSEDLERDTLENFVNEPMLDFSKESNRMLASEALATLEKTLPISVTSIVDGKKVEPKSNGDVVETRSPSNLALVVSRASYASLSVVDEAVECAVQGFKSWSKAPIAERAGVLRKAAAIMRRDKFKLASIINLEVSKDFREADADIAEAIDFCEYYAKHAERLAAGFTTSHLPGEWNRFTYAPKGVALAISPWNFPLAILCGMAVAPLVCGNTVIMKPAEESLAVASELYRILIEAGAPKSSIHLIIGSGETIGAALVSHPKIHLVNFTGSRAVGLSIIEAGARVSPGQRHIKKVVAELGGKNALIIDDDADLDEAVVAAMQSAFKFQGQKCSALSRIIVLEPAYEKFKARLVSALASIKVGPSSDPSSKVSAVINQESQQRLMQVIERNRDKIVFQLPVPEEMVAQGYFVTPTIFESTDPKSELGQQEFFGPLVTLFKAKTLAEAVDMANDVDYALTGGVISRNPESIAYVKANLEVGNMYINRGITGALVGRQPFGGFKLSGVGAKAGGPDYLLQFVDPKTSTENTMRRGFAPEI
jgi:RHH-type transcriptional regulator, proline utilization regulon repressor / proline dehydrogenase / delta 1-pyrroline-5-carboxylate dehydrogenase